MDESSSESEPMAFVEPANTRGSWFDSPHVHVIVRNDAVLRTHVELPPPPNLQPLPASTCPRECPRNVLARNVSRPIVAALKIRVYDGDAARISAHELVQWIQFHRLAGVDRVLLCDAFDVTRPHEALLPHLWPLVRAGVVEYYNFSAFAPPFVLDPLMAQSHCYFTLLHGADESEMAWATTIDVDEFVVAPHDRAPGYVRRQLERLPARVSALMLENFVMHGVPNASEELLVNRVRQRTIEPTRGLHKYFVRPQRARAYDIHRVTVDTPKSSVEMNRSALFFLHAWGARAFGFGATEMPARLAQQMQPCDEPRLIADLLVECARKCRRDEFHWLAKPGPPFWVPLREV